jgi:hypothetical protein
LELSIKCFAIKQNKTISLFFLNWQIMFEIKVDSSVKPQAPVALWSLLFISQDYCSPQQVENAMRVQAQWNEQAQIQAATTTVSTSLAD